MTSIPTNPSSGISINNPNVKAIDLSTLKKFHVHEADDATYKRMMEAQEKILESRYMQFPDTSKHPSYKAYATVEKNGEVIATINNNGSIESSNAVGARIQKLLAEGQENNLRGPELAQAMAAKIAERFGGTVEESSTALSLAEYMSVPPLPEITIDYQAMKEDPAYEQLQKTKQARTLYLAQQIAQEGKMESFQTRQVESSQVESQSVEGTRKHI